MTPLRLLVTGPPGVGKTTLCAEVYQRLVAAHARGLLDGFLCHERRDARHHRVGFDLASLDGHRTAPLARVDDTCSVHKVGKYTVQLADMEEFAFPILDRAIADSSGTSRLLIFDEIGKMELYSNGFVTRIKQLLASPDPQLHILGTVALNGGGFIAESKRMRGVEVVSISDGTRDDKTHEMFERFATALSAAPMQPTLASSSSHSADLQGDCRTEETQSRLGSISVTFDTPAPGNFSAVFLKEPSANFASLNAGDYSLYVGGGSINWAFYESLVACGQNPKDRYEVLHEVLLTLAASKPGQLYWVKRGTVFKPAVGLGGVQRRCQYCKKSCECWDVPWSNFKGSYCSECLEYYEDWLFGDITDFCGLLPRGSHMEKLRPVGLVSIAIFAEGRRPHRNDRNVAMVYVVGPNCGRRKRGRRAVDEMSGEAFLQVIEVVSDSIAEAVSAYNAQLAETSPSIDVLRLCLIGGGDYKHPDVSKLQVAKSVVKGLVSRYRKLPCLDFAWDDDAFRSAWRALESGET